MCATHFIYRFNQAVSNSSTHQCIGTLTSWHEVDPDAPWTIILNCPGGLVMDGMPLFDFLMSMRAKGHHITTIAQGMAASMAGILLQAGDVRLIGPESVILIHEISFGAFGKPPEMEDEVAFLKMLSRRVLNIFASRSNLSAAQIQRKWNRKDWWLDSDEALELGFVDGIVETL